MLNAARIHQFLDQAPLQTPAYLFSSERAKNNYSSLKQALGTELIVSIKANSTEALIQRMAHIPGIAFEVASLNELRKVAGFQGDIYVNNPAMSEELMKSALSLKATVLIDNPEQFHTYAGLPKASEQSCILRMSPQSLSAFGYVPGKKEVDHFGLDLESLNDVLDMAIEKNIPIGGLHLFSGSYSFESALQRISPISMLVDYVEDRLQTPIERLNLGGGFPEDWREKTDQLAQYQAQLTDAFPEHLSIMHESGRAIFADAGVYVAQVQYVKKIDGQIYIVTNGGLSSAYLLTMNEMVIKKYRQPEVISTQNEKLIAPAMVVGCSCNRTDIFGRLSVGQVRPEKGDLIYFQNCGAYHHTYTMKSFLSLPESTVYLLD